MALHTWNELARRAWPASGTQREQWYTQATQEVANWLLQMGRSAKYARSCVFAVLIGLPPSATFAQLVTIAKLVAWIYEVDLLLDSPAARDLVWLRAYCAALVAPVQSRTGQERSANERAVEESSAVSVQNMLEHWLAECARLWRSSAETQHHLYDQIELLVKTMRYEAEVAIGVEHCPTLDAYLAQAQYSIGLPLVSYAIAGVFGTCDVWLRDQQIVLRAARCVRLVNDLANARREKAEGKQTSFAFIESADATRQLALQEGEYVRTHISPETREALSTFLLFTVAMTLVHYEEGTFVELN